MTTSFCSLAAQYHFSHWVYNSFLNNISMKNIFLASDHLCFMSLPWWKFLSPLYLLLCFRKMSAAFDGVLDFHSWNISHEFMVTFMKYGRSDSNKKTFRIIFILQSMLLLHWRGSMMKFWKSLNQEWKKLKFTSTLWE